MMNELIIFGCGGVGSWVANFVARDKLFKVITLVDFDVVEEKNLQRQNYYRRDIGLYKTSALKDDLSGINKNITCLNLNRKVYDEIDLIGLNKEAIVLIATDNIISKRVIAQHFKNFLIVNCDKNFVEIKNYLDESDMKAWDMGGGYSNAQDITSNLYASTLVYFILREGYSFNHKYKFVKKIETDFFNSIEEVKQNAEQGRINY